MKNSTKFLSGTLALAIIAVVSTSTAFAYRGDPSVEGPDHSPEREAEMTQAFESNNYEAWTNLMEDKGRVTQVVNADNFSRFAEAHKLGQEGKLEESKAIRAELGLGQQDGSGKGQGQGNNGQGKNGQGKGAGNGNQSGAKDGSGVRGGTADCTLNN